MTAKQEIIAAAWRVNPTATSVRIVEIIKAGGTEVSKSAVDNMKKELGLVATGQRGRKKANPSSTAEANPTDEQNAKQQSTAVDSTAKNLPLERTSGDDMVTATASSTPVTRAISDAPAKARKPKLKLKLKAKKSTSQSVMSSIVPPEPFDGVVRQYADRCVAYLTQEKSGTAGSKSCITDLRRAFAVLGISF